MTYSLLVARKYIKYDARYTSTMPLIYSVYDNSWVRWVRQMRKLFKILRRYVFLFALDFSLASHASNLMRSFIDEWHLSKYLGIIRPRDLTMSRAHNFLLSLPAKIEFRRLRRRKVKGNTSILKILIKSRPNEILMFNIYPKSLWYEARFNKDN